MMRTGADAAANIISNAGTTAEADATNVATLSAIENQSEQTADNSAQSPKCQLNL